MMAEGKYEYRINHISWWKEEMPTQEEMNYGLERLNRYGNKVDYILTHDGPYSVYSETLERNELNSYFDELTKRVDFAKWFFGHHHVNKNIDDKYVLLYEKIILLITRN